MATRQEDSNKHTDDSKKQIKIVIAGGSNSNSVEAYVETEECKERKRTWQLLARPMNKHRQAASAVLYKEKEEKEENKEKPRKIRMIVTGGSENRNVEELDLAQQNKGWIESPFQLPLQQLYGHACVRDGDRLIVIGGRLNSDGPGTGKTPVYEIQLTSPHASRLLGYLPGEICQHRAEKIGSEIFIIGGMERSGMESTRRNKVLLLRHKRRAESTSSENLLPYEELNPLPYAVSQMATAVLGDHVFVLGGTGDQGEVLDKAIMYNVTTKKLERRGRYCELPKMNNKRSGCTAVAIGDDIMVMGGYNETGPGTALKSVEYYNYKTGVWKDCEPMTEPRAFATAVRCNVPWQNITQL